MPSRKVWFLRNFLLCLIGILFILLSFMLVKFDYQKLGESEEYKTIQKAFEVGEIEELHLAEKTANVEVRQSKDKQIHIRYVESKNVYPKMVTEKETKKISFERNVKVSLNPFGSGSKNVKTIVEIPPSMKLDLEVDTGNIRIESIQLENITLKTRTGNIVLEKVDGNEIQIESQTGNIYGKTLGIAHVSVKTDTGNIQMHFKELREKYTVYAKSESRGILYDDKNSLDSHIHIVTEKGNIKLSFKKG